MTVSLARSRVVIAGVGGIGCPAAWALAEAGVGELVLVDPDTVALHNLPRQVLFAPGDEGLPKVDAAARRLRRQHPGLQVRTHHGALEGASAAALLPGAQVLVDASDGAAAKDAINALAVQHGLALVHAAGVRSEARLLDVPAGGRPCLACLFGRLEGDDAATCALLGVWNGTVGAAGMLAAAAVIRRLAHPRAPSQGYDVLDLGQRRWTRLQAAAREGCEACAPGARPAVPVRRAPAIPTAAGPAPAGVLDLRLEHCPLNLLRARQHVEGAPGAAVVTIWLGAEGAASVPEGLRALGHEVEVHEVAGAALAVRARAVGAGAGARGGMEALAPAALERFARQVVMPELGVEGQRRLLRARVRIAGPRLAAEAAQAYLQAAGVPDVQRADGPALRGEVLGAGLACEAGLDASGRACVGEAGLLPPDSSAAPYAPHAMLLGVLLADALQRAVVLDGLPASLRAPGATARPA